MESAGALCAPEDGSWPSERNLSAVKRLDCFSLFTGCNYDWRHESADFIDLLFVVTVVLTLASKLWFRILWCAVSLVEAAEDWIESDADLESASVVFAE